jgi:MoCo/4Fe-4S cofactor protein with predicted Tat translocation signal
MAGDCHNANSNAAPAPPPELWRTTEELANSEEFRDMVSREFPDDAETWTDPVSRRQFLTVMGASFALAGLNGCSPRPASPQKVRPYTTQPEGMTLGVPNFYPTATVLSGVASGILVKSHEGRPVKIEGNPYHPGSLGSTDVFSQAAVLELCDPDRSQTNSQFGASRTWDEAVLALRTELDKLKDLKGSVRLLTETITSPTLAAQIDKFVKKYEAKWVQFEPLARDNVRAGNKQAFGGEAVDVIYDFTKAKVVVALDADFLTSGPGAVRYARDFAARRKVRRAAEDGVAPDEMNRLYAVETMLTSTGAVADHRLPLKAGDVEGFARALAVALKVNGATAGGVLPESAKAWLAPLVKDLESNKGKSIVIAGAHQPATVHALANAINSALGNLGKTVKLIKSIEARPAEQVKEFKALVAEMNTGKVDLLLILGGNPVYNTPADVDFAKALKEVKLRAHLGLYRDETAEQCQWHLNEAHVLETWGDARAYDGTVTIMQPMIAPLYSGHSALELVTALEAAPDQIAQSGLGALQAYWKENGKSKDFEHFWHEALQTGVVPGTAFETMDKSLAPDWMKADRPSGGAGEVEICFRPDPTLYDGRFANLGWLQELPKPVSKLCWDNAVLMSLKKAKELGIKADPRWTAGERGRMEVEYVEVTFKGQKLIAAAWPQPGHADDAVTIYLGSGREFAGRVSKGAGFNAYKIRPSDSFWSGNGVEIKKLENTINLACTQAHHVMEGRKPIRYTTAKVLADMGQESTKAEATKTFNDVMAPPVAAGEYDLIKLNVPGPFDRSDLDKEHSHDHDHDHDHAEGHKHDKRIELMTMYPATNQTGHRWSMAIDLTSCIGCNVCMIACMAENSIPVVGKTEVTRAREMYWIRVDRYHVGDPDSPEGLKTYFQPVPCQQCEKAPCEVVCPVGATVHSTDGLNDMVYNRCVGTRYCSNNCPYKVRRFNFLTYADYITESLKLGRNPEVTVRTRGVMEKCTYCVQRIRSAEIEAEREWSTRPKDSNGRPMIYDRAIMTACEAACPTNAIVFGDLSDTWSEKEIVNPVSGTKFKVKGSDVRRWKAEPTNFGLLAELNTMPRTTYLAALRNPNPDMPKGT